MNIVIDQGNASTKVAFFEKDQIVVSFIFNLLTKDNLLELIEQYKPQNGILSSVISIDTELTTILEQHVKHFFVVNESLPLPITLAYKTPNTLGKDRLAAVIGAQMLSPNQAVLVIDAGTAITFDFITATGVYLGGNISPGMTTRFRALNQFTNKLPLIDEEGEVPEIGYDTETAIRSGVIVGMCYEIDQYISYYKQKHPQLFVFLTGGHSFYFERRLKNSTFADNNLVLKGLNRIINYNVKK